MKSAGGDRGFVHSDFRNEPGSSPEKVEWDDAVRLIREFSQLKPGDRILDVACGHGALAFELARHCAYLMGIDLSDEMIARASERAIESSVNNVSFQVGDAGRLDFPDKSFDRVYCRLGLHHFDDPGAAVGEMLRVLKTPGHLVIADIVSSEDPAWRDAHNRIERARDASHNSMLSPRQLLALLEESGASLERQTQWQTRRRFGEWMRRASADKTTIERTRKLLHEAAKRRSTDLDIAIRGNNLEFTHRWLACMALKLQ